jgi:EAL domain-containing protein (putative c-di-GMP-specific phosphodiesterase class I)
MLEDESDASIVRALVGLADALSIDLVAEGVETEEQVEFLRDCGCKVAQGFLFGRPVGAEEVVRVRVDPCASYLREEFKGRTSRATLHGGKLTGAAGLSLT